MICPREASLEEETTISLKTEGSTRKAGDPRPKVEPTRYSLGLSFELIDYP